MRNYKKIQTEKNTVTKIVCNKCKKEITIKNGIPEEEMLTVEKRWGKSIFKPLPYLSCEQNPTDILPVLAT